MAKTVVGDVIVRFGADTQTFSVALDSANAKLRAAGKGWAATLSQLPKATRDAAAQASQDFKKIGQAAKESAAAVDAAGRKQEGAITRLMATRALTRGLSGTPSITSAERFLGNYLNLGDYAKSIFPVTGGLAVGVLLNELVGKAEAAYAALKKMETAPQRIAAAFQTLNGKIGQSNDELALSNDKLRNAIAVLQGGKTNNLAIMLDEARVAADKLSGSLKADLASVSSLLQANSTSWWAQALGKAGTGDINKLFQGANGYGGFQKQISDIMLNANQALATAKTPGDAEKIRAQERIQLEKAYGVAIGDVNKKLAESRNLQAARTKALGASAFVTTAQGVVIPNSARYSAPSDQSARIAELAGLLSNLLAARNSISLLYDNSALTTRKDVLDSQRTSANTDHLPSANQMAPKFKGPWDLIQANQRLQQKMVNDGAELAEEQAKSAIEAQQRLAQLTSRLTGLQQEGKYAGMGTYAAAQARIGAMPEDTPEDIVKKAIARQQLADSIAKQVAQINAQAAAVKRLNAVQGEGPLSQLNAHLANIRNSGQAQALIQAQTTLAKAQYQPQAWMQGGGKAGAKQFFTELQNNVHTTAQDVHDILGGAFQDLGRTMTGLIEGQKGAWSQFFYSLSSQLASAGINKLGGWLADAVLPHFASGGYSSGGLAIVGEDGPELVNLPRGAHVTPNNKLGGGNAYYSIDARGANAADVEMRVRRALVAVHGSAVRTAIGVQKEIRARSPKGVSR